MNCDVKSLIGKFNQRFDAAILGPDWSNIFKGILDQVFLPPRRDFLAPEDINGPLTNFFEIFDKTVAPDGVLILEFDKLEPFKIGLLANEIDNLGVFPEWKLAMVLWPANARERHTALIFFREGIPPFVQEAFTALGETGKFAPDTSYFGESAQLVRQFFQDGALVAMWEYEWQSNKVQTIAEFLQKGGLGLHYKASSAGGHIAHLMPEAELSAGVEQFKIYLKEKEENGLVKIINIFPV